MNQKEHRSNSTFFDCQIAQQIDQYGLNLYIYLVVIVIVILIIIILASEIAAYLWHRLISHQDIISPIRQTHLNHHQANWLHEAHSDFIWIVIGLVLLIIVLAIIYYLNLAPFWLLTIIAIISISIAVWNWYIHMAYHQANHWLEKYDWFRRDRQLHLIHHIHPNFNYGIASHFNDRVFNTYKSGNQAMPLYPNSDIVGLGTPLLRKSPL